MSAVPIVFIHSGNNDYLRLAIRQAKFFNAASEIFLLGDDSNQVLSKNCSHVFMNRFTSGLAKLKDVYSHSSTNSYEFELNCFARWFILRDFMRENKIKWVCHLDSDFMLYSSITEYFDTYIASTEKEAALCIPFQEHHKFRWTASGHIAFVSLAFLDKFCEFVIDVYENNYSILGEKIDYHKQDNIPGGICDMTLLYLYSKTYPITITNLLTISDNRVFDHNINMASNYLPDEFIKEGGYKKIYFKKQLAYSSTTKGEEINFIGLHFQGDAKREMIFNYYNKLETLKYSANEMLKRVRNKLRRMFKLAK